MVWKLTEDKSSFNSYAVLLPLKFQLLTLFLNHSVFFEEAKGIQNQLSASLRGWMNNDYLLLG
jgi:hypothetical protein